MKTCATKVHCCQHGLWSGRIWARCFSFPRFSVCKRFKFQHGQEQTVILFSNTKSRRWPPCHSSVAGSFCSLPWIVDMNKKRQSNPREHLLCIQSSMWLQFQEVGRHCWKIQGWISLIIVKGHVQIILKMSLKNSNPKNRSSNMIEKSNPKKNETKCRYHRVRVARISFPGPCLHNFKFRYISQHNA